MNPVQIATDLLMKQSWAKLGGELSELIERDDGEKLFKEKVKSLSSEKLRMISSELFSNVKRSNELLKVACYVNQVNREARVIIENLIEKTHQLVDCSGVCLYVFDKNRLIIALTNEPSIFADVRLSNKCLVGLSASEDK